MPDQTWRAIPQDGVKPRAPLPTHTRYNRTDSLGVLITPAFRKEAAELAARTTIKNAERRYRVSAQAIGRWMNALGIKARRACCPTKEEADKYGPDYVL